MILSSSLLGMTGNQFVSVAYFDQERVQLNIPELPAFLQEKGEEKADRGYMVFYEKKLFDLHTIFSFYAGGNIGQYTKADDTLYTGSLFVSTRFWLMHLLVLHPYIEVSLFGPTILSKSEFNLKSLNSNFLFQNVAAVGVELGAGSGLFFELKAIRYLQPATGKEIAGVQVPLLVSLGYLF